MTVPAVERVAPAVEMVGITKRFGSVVACDHVSLSVRPGEIHGLLGRNGAGKTTLMRILLGLVVPDAGTIRVGGREVEVRDPRIAAELGIAMVHQHFSLVPALRVWENVVLGAPGRLDRDAARRRVRELGERYGLAVDPDARVETLTTGERQRVEIVKCLWRDPSLLVLDEPTSVLTLAESRELFTVLRRVAGDEGRAVILISHRLDEIRHATDRVTVMRDGAVVARRETARTDDAELAREMLGPEAVAPATAGTVTAGTVTAGTVTAGTVTAGTVTSRAPAGARPAAAGEVRLGIRDAHATAPDGTPLLRGLSLRVHAGEILGVAGVEGNGQAALGDLLSSLLRLDSGVVEVCGRPVRTGRPGAMQRAGVGVIPEDRHRSGCVLDMTVAENLVLTDVGRVAGRGLVRPRRLREHAARLIEEFGIVPADPGMPMRLLSGGNQQKVVLARELAANPRVLVAAQPTRGLDVGAAEFLTKRLRRAADDGVAVLLISTELEEILALADRIAVIHRGAIAGELDRDEVADEAAVARLGLLMGGRAA